jgi:cell division protein FtsB
MSLSQREKTLLVITIFGLMVFCYGWFAYLPLQSKIAALQVDNQRLTQEQTKLEIPRLDNQC